MKKIVMLVLVLVLAIGIIVARENDKLKVNKVPQSKDAQLTYDFFNHNEVNSAICNQAEYIYHFSNENEIPDYYGLLYPYSWLGNTDENEMPLNYVYQITPNIHAFAQFAGQDAPDLQSEIALRPSGMTHHGEFGPGNPGLYAEDNQTDFPWMSSFQWGEGSPQAQTYIWWQHYLLPGDVSQCDTTVDHSDLDFWNSWNFGENLDIHGLNHYQDYGLVHDVVDFSPTNKELYGLIGEDNFTTFSDDFNPEAQFAIDEYTYAGNPSPHLPTYLQFQKYFYQTKAGEFNNVIILNYRLTNRSDLVASGELQSAGLDSNLPITLRGFQFSLFVDPDMGQNDFLDDRVHAKRIPYTNVFGEEDELNMLIYTDDNGVGEAAYDVDGTGIPTTFYNIPERGVATVFLGMRKGMNDDARASESTFYFDCVNSIRNLTADGYREGGELNNNYGHITTNTDTTDIQKRWIWFNSYFYPRSFTSLDQEAWFEENGALATGDVTNTDGYDAWGSITVGSITTAPTTSEVADEMDAISPVDFDDLIYPTASSFDQIFDPEKEITIAPGEHVVVSFAFIVGNNIVTEDNWESIEADPTQTSPYSLAAVAAYLKDRYPFYQLWPMNLANNDAGENFWDVATDIDNNIPNAYSLSQNYPNPFNPTTTINFSLDKKEKVELAIYNINGQRVKTLYNGFAEGNNSVVWDGTTDSGMKASSGVYFYKLEGETINATKKMVMLK